jgi:hypothetical protein
MLLFNWKKVNTYVVRNITVTVVNKNERVSNQHYHTLTSKMAHHLLDIAKGGTTDHSNVVGLTRMCDGIVVRKQVTLVFLGERSKVGVSHDSLNNEC